MTALLDYFHEAVTTKEDVNNLKKFILQLAIQGKLVYQDTREESASKLLLKIIAKKERMIEDNKLKKTKALQPLTSEEVPYEIPKEWKWVRLSEVFDVRDGTHDTPKYIDEGIPLVTSKNISKGELSLENVKYISAEDHENISKRSKVEIHDILFAMIGSIGNPIIVNVEPKFSIKNVALFKYYSKELSNPEFLYYFLLFAQDIMKQKSSGAVQSFVSLTYIRSFPFPLPPLNEQRRIVEKIKELFAKCDKLSSELINKQIKLETLNKSIFTRIQDHKNNMSIDDLRFAINNIEHLCNDKVSIDQLRNSLLSLAMQGKLLEQDPTDEPASKLLKKIEAEKENLFKEKKIKKEKLLPPITKKEILYELPKGWEWARLGTCFVTTSGSTPSRSNKKYFENGVVNWVKTTDLTNGIVNRCEEKISQEALLDSNLKVLPQNTVCIAMYGGRGTIGKSGIFKFESTINQSICAVLPNQYINPEYFHYYIKFSRPKWMNYASSTRKDPNINKEIIKNFIIPVPPLNEQKRIVEKVNQLMVLCEELERNIENSKQDNAGLMKAVLQEAFAVKE